MPQRTPRTGPVGPGVGPITPEELAALPEVVDTNPVTRGLAPFDPGRTAIEIVNLRRPGAHIVIEIGRRLLQGQQYHAFAGGGGRGTEGEGFRAFCERAGIGYRQAYNYIRIVTRLAETGLLDGGETPLLAMSAGVTKLLTIVELDPEDMRCLDEGGRVPGVGTLDEIDRMTTSELRRRLRDTQGSVDRAKARLKTTEDERDNFRATTEELGRKLREGPYEPCEIAVEFAGQASRLVRWAHSVKDNPRPEREAAYADVMNHIDEIVRIIQRALVYERLSMDPLTTTDLDDIGM